MTARGVMKKIKKNQLDKVLGNVYLNNIQSQMWYPVFETAEDVGELNRQKVEIMDRLPECFYELTHEDQQIILSCVMDDYLNGFKEVSGCWIAKTDKGCIVPAFSTDDALSKDLATHFIQLGYVATKMPEISTEIVELSKAKQTQAEPMQ